MRVPTGTSIENIPDNRKYFKRFLDCFESPSLNFLKKPIALERAELEVILANTKRSVELRR